MRTEPAVLIAAASPWLNQAISPALKELARARTAIRITARPARAGRELRNQLNITADLKGGEHRHGGTCKGKTSCKTAIPGALPLKNCRPTLPRENAGNIDQSIDK